jgi:hypothetical protein
LKRPWLPWSLMILVWSWATQWFIISWWVKWFSYPYFYGKIGRIWASSVGLTAQLLLTSSRWRTFMRPPFLRTRWWLNSLGIKCWSFITAIFWSWLGLVPVKTELCDEGSLLFICHFRINFTHNMT